MADLGIDTTGWLHGCGHPGCQWLLDPNHPECPEHTDRPWPVATTDEEIAEAKRAAYGERLPPFPDSAYPAGSVPLEELEPPLPCFCGAPAVGWTYSVMSDGQTIDGIAVCAAHQEEQL